MKQFAFTYGEILKMGFPETDEMKLLQIRNKGTDEEFITDPRTITDDYLNSIVYPVTENDLWYVYVCPNCGKFHIRGKHLYGDEDYYEEWFVAPENSITCIQDWKEISGHRNNMIHLKDFDNMTGYKLEMYSAMERINQTLRNAQVPELREAYKFLFDFGCFEGFQARFADEYAIEAANL